MVYAQETQVPQGVAAGRTAGAAFSGLLPLILIFVIFYFLLIRPQQKQAKKHQQILNALKRGDRVITSGGIYGTVSKIDGKEIELKVGEPDVRLTFSKDSISHVLTPQTDITR